MQMWKAFSYLLIYTLILLILYILYNGSNHQPSPSTSYQLIIRPDNSTFYHGYVLQRQDTSDDIAIIVVVEGTAHRSEYLLAQNTLECYARLHSYHLYFLDITKDPAYGGHCPHKDFMFKRHCVVSHFMAQSPHKWFLFLDGDIGVVNPNHFIEEYLPTGRYSMLFYKRIMNHEVMAGSYLARNDPFSRQFLLNWANYEYKTPKSFHGTDNGAVHSAVADLSAPGDPDHRKHCFHLWNISRNYNGLAKHAVCMQLYLEKFPPPRIQLLQKGRLPYCRDGWLTNSAWSHKDFMFHGWQLTRKDKKIFAQWHSPLVEQQFALDKCFDPWAAGTQWRQVIGNVVEKALFRYKNSFFRKDTELDKTISNRIKTVAKEFLKYSKEMNKRLQH